MPETNTFELTLGNEDRVFEIRWWWVIVVHLVRDENKVPV
jgi:hypothetical protein